MKFELFTVLVFVALSAVAAAPRTFVGTCDVQMLVRDGRDAEGLAIPGATGRVSSALRHERRIGRDHRSLRQR
jgi:hypothetical protein